MIKSAATAIEPARDNAAPVQPLYLEALTPAEADVKRVVKLIKINEYKRRQAPVGVRITPRGFGKDWRYPITSKYPNGL